MNQSIYPSPSLDRTGSNVSIWPPLESEDDEDLGIGNGVEEIRRGRRWPDVEELKKLDCGELLMRCLRDGRTWRNNSPCWAPPLPVVCRQARLGWDVCERGDGGRSSGSWRMASRAGPCAALWSFGPTNIIV